MDAAHLHRESVVVDGHTDLPTRLFYRPADVTERLDDGHVDLPRLREGGVDAVVAALFVPPVLDPEEGWEHALDLWRALEAQLRPGGLELAVRASQVRTAAARGAVAAVLGLENGRPLVLSGTLDECARMGVRYVTLTHVASHEWCDASTDDPVHGGLSPEGVELVRRMNALGILADVSHVSDDAVRHVLDVAPLPPVASHSSARALCDHPRNLPDELVRAIARRGGVVMANSYPAFLDPAADRANREIMGHLKGLYAEVEELPAGERRAALPGLRVKLREVMDGHTLPEVGLEVLVAHVMHLVELAGEEHVGVGTDFDGIPETLKGFADASEFPNLTEALLARGLDPQAVRLILGENFLRLLERAERAA